MPVVPSVREVDTPSGPARLHVDGDPARAPVLVLGHGAGGGVDAPDLLAAQRAGTAAGLAVVRVEQPWRVRGRRIAEAPPRLDAAWLAALTALGPTGPLVLGGRSAGARVACRTADALGAVAVLCLAFPLTSPSGASRLDELQQPAVPRLVVQGARDAFGVPEPAVGLQVHAVAGADHALAVRRLDGRTGAEVLDEVQVVVAAWLDGLPLGGGPERGQTLT